MDVPVTLAEDAEASYERKPVKLPQPLGRAILTAQQTGCTLSNPTAPPGMASLISQVQTMVEESGRPEGFNAAEWVTRWIDRPLPALDGQRPAELMGTAEGRALVSSIVARMQTGAYS
jgi:hypothetical protein